MIQTDPELKTPRRSFDHIQAIRYRLFWLHIIEYIFGFECKALTNVVPLVKIFWYLEELCGIDLLVVVKASGSEPDKRVLVFAKLLGEIQIPKLSFTEQM